MHRVSPYSRLPIVARLSQCASAITYACMNSFYTLRLGVFSGPFSESRSIIHLYLLHPRESLRLKLVPHVVGRWQRSMRIRRASAPIRVARGCSRRIDGHCVDYFARHHICTAGVIPDTCVYPSFLCETRIVVEDVGLVWTRQDPSGEPPLPHFPF